VLCQRQASQELGTVGQELLRLFNSFIKCAWRAAGMLCWPESSHGSLVWQS